MNAPLKSDVGQAMPAIPLGVRRVSLTKPKPAEASQLKPAGVQRDRNRGQGNGSNSTAVAAISETPIRTMRPRWRLLEFDWKGALSRMTDAVWHRMPVLPLGKERNTAAGIAVWSVAGFAVGMLLAHALFGDFDKAMPMWAWEPRQWRSLVTAVLTVLLWRRVVEPALERRRCGHGTPRTAVKSRCRHLNDVLAVLLLATTSETLVAVTVGELDQNPMRFLAYLGVGLIGAGGTTYRLVRGAQRSPRRLVWNVAWGGTLTKSALAGVILLVALLVVLVNIANGRPLSSADAQKLIGQGMVLTPTLLMFWMLSGPFCALAIKHRLSSPGLAIALAMAIYMIAWREVFTFCGMLTNDFVALFWQLMMAAAGWGLGVSICPGAEHVLGRAAGGRARLRPVHVFAAFAGAVLVFLPRNVRTLNSIVGIEAWRQTNAAPEDSLCSVAMPARPGKDQPDRDIEEFSGWHKLLSKTTASHCHVRIGSPETVFESWR